MLKAEELDRLAGLEREATPVEWRHSMSGYSIKTSKQVENDGDYLDIVASVGCGTRATNTAIEQFCKDAPFIAALRNAAPALIAAAREGIRLAAEVKEYKSRCQAWADQSVARDKYVHGLEREVARLRSMVDGHHPGCNYLASPVVCNKCGWTARAALTPEASHAAEPRCKRCCVWEDNACGDSCDCQCHTPEASHD